MWMCPRPSPTRPSTAPPSVQVEKALNALGAARIAGMVSLGSSAKRCPLLWPLVGVKVPAVGLACEGARTSFSLEPADELNLPPISAESFFAELAAYNQDEHVGAFGLQGQGQLGDTDAAKPMAIYSACLRPPPPAASESIDSLDTVGVGLDTVAVAPLEDFELLVRAPRP